jgi:alpha-L-fucosidase 2
MQLLKNSLFFTLAITALFTIGCKHQSSLTDASTTPNSLQLWYHQPAKSWMQEALPIGNAYMGAMIFGGLEEERIQFNEESLWAGGKGAWSEYNGGNREGAAQYLPKVRELLKAGKFEAANALANKELTGVIKGHKNEYFEGFGAYQAFSDIYIQTQQEGELKNYKRSLDISQAIASVEYQTGKVKHQREYFASYPKRMLVFRIKNDASKGLDYTLRTETPHPVESIFKDNQLIMSGKLENNGMGFESRMYLDADGAAATFENGKVHIKSAKTITIYLTAATDYVNEYPHYKGRNYSALNQKSFETALTSNYESLKAEHIQDYSSLFSRIDFELDGPEKHHIPTNERLIAYKEGQEDVGLESLFFQYGRYLLISSSRPGSLPANLQGKWNYKTNPPWASDYHANINVQMIYWPAEVANLPECHEPLIEYIDKLRAPGRKSAQTHFGAKGWIVNTMNNVFGYTAPGWNFPWGFFPGGAAWYSRHVWEHYQYTQDLDYLKNKAYPIMKEAALFWLDYLIEEDGRLISAPSYSPEHGGISMGASMDMQIVWDLFTNSINACEALGINDDFKKEIVAAKAKLLAPQIGKWGQLQEWKEDRDDPENKHRHVSHLYALYPSKQVNPLETPKLAEAAKVSLNARGDGGTGWSLGWKTNFWARLEEGNRAYKVYRRAIHLTDNEGVEMHNGGGSYSNLLCAHPPFQLDGNMGATAGVAEMLLQSHAGVIHLLPALPKAWPSGKIKGLKARGGYEVDIEWKNGELVQAVIKAQKSGSCKIKYKNQIKSIHTKAKTPYQLDATLENR